MNRGEVWIAKLSPTVGTEISKTRPVVIMNDDTVGILPLKVVVPITDWKDRFASRSWMVKLEPSPDNGLRKTSAADTFQIRSLSETRFSVFLGKLSDSEMQAIAQALSAVLSL